MINPATQPIPDWNPFTEYLRDNPGTFVKLRNGVYVKPVFFSAEDVHCSDVFGTEDAEWYAMWHTNGKSFTSRDYDMMEMDVE